MTELLEPGHEREARRWVRFWSARRSLVFAVGAAGPAAVVARARELDPDRTVVVLESSVTDAWRCAHPALQTLPERGVLVLDLSARPAGGEPAARDWLGLNLARDVLARAERHVLVWLMDLRDLDAVRDGAADLWSYRSALVMFPSAMDFAVQEGHSGPTIWAELGAVVKERDADSSLGSLADLVTATHGSAWWFPLFSRAVLTTWRLHGVRWQWCAAIAERCGGEPLAVIIRRFEQGGSGGARSLAELRAVQRGQNRLVHRTNCAAGLAPDRPQLASVWVSVDAPPGPAVYRRRTQAVRDDLLAIGHSLRLDAPQALTLAHQSLTAFVDLAWFNAVGSPTSTATTVYACLGLPGEAVRVLASIEARATDPWMALTTAAQLGLRGPAELRTTVEARLAGPGLPRAVARAHLNAALVLRLLGTPEDLHRAIALLGFADEPPALVPFLRPVEELAALRTDSPDPVEAALAFIRDADPGVLRPAPHDLDTLTYDPVADLRVDALVLRAALLRDLGRPREALADAIRATTDPPTRTIRQAATDRVELARCTAATGDTPGALSVLDAIETALESERDATVDVRPLTPLVAGAVLRSRLLHNVAPIDAALDLCLSEEHRAFVLELHLEVASRADLPEARRRAAARAALSVAQEAGFLVLEARASAWCAHLGGADAVGLRTVAEWVAARSPDPRLASALASRGLPEPIA